MSNQPTTSRRSFIAAALSGTTAALAGCNTSGGEAQASTSENKEDKQENTLPKEEKFSKEEFEESLKALTYDLDEDLSYEGFDPKSQIAELKGEAGDDINQEEGKYELEITLDSDSLLHGSGLLVGNQDFYTAAEVDAAYNIFEDAERQLEETTAIVDKRLNEFSEETEIPEGYTIEVEFEFEGARGSAIEFGFEYGEKTVEEATQEFLAEIKKADKKGDGHGVNYHPGKYENLALLEDGDSLTFQDGGETSEEHTIEYDGGNQVLVNGDEYRPREDDGMIKTQVLGKEIRVNQFNPLYLQERGEIPEAVELEFENASPDY